MIFVQDYQQDQDRPLHASDAQIELYMNSTGSYHNIEIPTEGNIGEMYWFVGCFKGNDQLLDDFAIVNELSPLNPYDYNKTSCLKFFPD